MENGVWVLREERADGETEKEEREENWNNEMEEREILKVNKICIYFLEYYYSTILTLELYCNTIAKKFVIVGFAFFWCKAF